MAATASSLILNVYAPALGSDSSRAIAAVRGMEHALPGLRMEWTLSDEGQRIPLADRDAWITQGRPEGGGFPLLRNGDDHFRVTLSGGEIPAGGKPLLHIHAKLPLNETVISVAADVLERVAESSHALWGHATPQHAARDIAEQTSRPLQGPHRPPRGLPVLKKSEHLRSPEIPHRLGWLNYWSGTAAQSIGFPAPSCDADLLSQARRTSSGGWVVWLTDAPLDLDNPMHLDVLLRTYERFPEIGGRAAP
jgi:hypothetical protein